GQLVQVLSLGVPVRDVAWSAKGQLLATVDNGGSIRLWATDSWRSLATASADLGKPLAGLAFSPQGNCLAGGGERGSQPRHVAAHPDPSKPGSALEPLARLTP